MVQNKSCHVWASAILLEDPTSSLKLHKRLNVRNKEVIPVPCGCLIDIDENWNKVGVTRVRHSSPYTSCSKGVSLQYTRICVLFPLGVYEQSFASKTGFRLKTRHSLISAKAKRRAALSIAISLAWVEVSSQVLPLQSRLLGMRSQGSYHCNLACLG